MSVDETEIDRLAAVAAGGSEDIIESAMRAAREALDMEMSFVARLDDGGQHVERVEGAVASFPGVSMGASSPLENSYCARMTAGVIPNAVPDARADERTRKLPATRDSRIGAYVGVPLTLPDGQLYGSFCCISNSAKTDLEPRDVKFMRVLARMVGDHIGRRETERERLRLEAQADASQALLAALEAREQYTGDHSKAVFDLSVAVAREIGLSEGDVAEAGQVALLHDIGKVGVPDAVLQKRGPLDDAEWAAMREHPAIGARIVASIEGLAHLAPAIRAEHERWDGGGYPDGVAGAEIPLASQICLVCDSYHAMTSDRPYRAALPVAAAVEELRAHSGTQFSPVVVEALLAVLGAAAVDAVEARAA
jgi:putative nucleotidyltransferase with HDIG domain